MSIDSSALAAAERNRCRSIKLILAAFSVPHFFHIHSPVLFLQQLEAL